MHLGFLRGGLGLLSLKQCVFSVTSDHDWTFCEFGDLGFVLDLRRINLWWWWWWWWLWWWRW